MGNSRCACSGSFGSTGYVSTLKETEGEVGSQYLHHTSVISSVAMGLIFLQIYNPNYGIVTSLVKIIT